MSSPPLALLLLRASRWFDARLLTGLADRGWPTLSPAQSLVFAHLDDGGVPPAELARRLGSSRQATADLIAGLVRHDLVALRTNPARRGGRLVILTSRGRALAKDARQLLTGLEHDLGDERASALRTLLEDFGR